MGSLVKPRMAEIAYDLVLPRVMRIALDLIKLRETGEATPTPQII